MKDAPDDEDIPYGDGFTHEALHCRFPLTFPAHVPRLRS